MSRIPMTVEGEKALRQELRKLKTQDRPSITDAIAQARKLGDLKENAEYHAARELQGFTEGRIKEIESKLARSEVIDVTKIPHTGRVVFGVRVELFDLATEQPLSWRIVGEDQADPKKGMISIGSPLARALIGKLEGSRVTAQMPAGEIQYEVVAVYHD